MLPWIMERGEVPVREVAERFGTTEAAVIADLERASMCGLPPFEPGDLIDLFVDDGIVHAGPPKFFTRPLRLTAPEGFALLVAGRAALQLPGAEPHGPLARALDKLAEGLGAAGLEVDLPRPAAADELAAAVEAGAQLRIAYWSGSRDETTERVIDPLAVFTDRGFWYVIADDHRSGEQRTFRIDRVDSIERTGNRFVRRSVTPPTEDGWFSDDDLPRVTLRLTAAGRWIAERYPVDAVTATADGGAEVVLPVTSETWLARLLVRAGRDAVVVAPPELAEVARVAAARVLARYHT